MPSVFDDAYHEWVNWGFTSLEHLYINNTFASFYKLALKFNIPNSLFFIYIFTAP